MENFGDKLELFDCKDRGRWFTVYKTKKNQNDSVKKRKIKMPELKRPLDTSDSTALVVAKKPRNELVQVTEKEKALVASVSLIECPKNLNQF